jgi:hypothetical protein
MDRRTTWTLRVVAAACVAVLLVGNTWADLPRPEPNPASSTATSSDAVPLQVFIDPQAAHSTIVIPKKLLPQLKSAFNDAAPPTFGAARSVIAAVALSCGIAGLFLARRNRAVRAIVVAAICVSAIAAAAQIFANVGPPPELFHRHAAVAPPPKHPTNNALWANEDSCKIVIEVCDDGGAVNLYLAKSAVGRLHIAGLNSSDGNSTHDNAPTAPRP